MRIWQHTAYILLFTVILLITACEAETTLAPPTRVPTSTPLPPTITPTPAPLNTSTPRPTQPAVPRINAENQADQTFVRVVHASPSISEISMDIQGLQIASTLPYPLATSPTGIEAGEYRLTISTPDNPALIERTILLAGESTQIFIISGSPDNPQLNIYSEPDQPLNATMSRVTFIHAIENSTPLTITTSGNILAESLNYGEMSSGSELDSAPTTFTFSIPDQTILDYPISLRSRQSIIMVVTGTVDAPEIITFTRQVEGIARVRIIHASPELNPVDVYVNSRQIASEIGFSRSTERQNLAALTTQIDIYPANASISNTEPLYTEQINLRTDQAMSLIIVGSNDTLDILTAIDDLSIIRPELTRIAFLNPLQQYDNVNVSLQGGTVPGVPELLGYGQISPAAELDANSYIFLWSSRSITQNEDDNNLLEMVENVQLAAGRSYLYILTGQENDTPLIFSEPIDIDNEAIDVPSDEALTPTPTTPTRMRFVNAIDEAPTVNIFLDTIGVANALGYGASTVYTITPADTQTIIVQNSETNAELATITFDFQLATNYSIYVYGYQLDGYSLFIVPDNRVIFNNNDSASIRLINLTYNDNEDFQLGASVSPETRQSQAEVTADSDEENTRPAVPAGINQISTTVESESASSQSTLPPSIYDIYIIDPGPNRVAGIFTNLTLQSQTVYEMIVYQDRFSRNVKGFLLSYNIP